MKAAERPLLIAEVKTCSPFGWKSTRSWDELFETANEHGDWISIHTNPRWGGSFKLLEKARLRTKKPILAKGLHLTDRELALAFNSGADYALVVGRIPDVLDSYRDALLIEPYTLAELAEIPHGVKAVWNSRDLRNKGVLKNETFKDARAIFPGWLCQASNIRTPADVCAGAQAILVGQELAGFVGKQVA
jgi:indole-3-glycerol phosphate synthase